MHNQPETKEQAEVMLLQLKNWTTAGESLMSEEQVEQFFENSFQLLIYCINKDTCLPEDEVSFAELLICLRSAFGRAGSRKEKADRLLLLKCLQKSDFLSLFVASFRALSKNSSNVSPNSAQILHRLAQAINNILVLHYSMKSNIEHIENSCLPLFDVDILLFVFNLPQSCSDSSNEVKELCSKLLYAFTALIHINLLNSERMREILTTPQLNHIWELQLMNCQKDQSEFSLLSFFIVLKKGEFFRSFYRFTSTTTNRLLLLDIVWESIQNEEEASTAVLKSWNCFKSPEEYLKMKSLSKLVLSDDGVLFLVETFQEEIDRLLSVPNSGNVDANFDEERIRLLCQQSSLLLNLSSSEQYSALIRQQHSQNLIEALVKLLKSLQLWSRNNPDSVFAFRGQLKDVDLNAESASNPAYGFKRDIIGLIANIVCRNREAQDYLRTSDGLAALLDSAKIDARNPFILQWSIFAIHNALECNEKNQHYVAQMRNQGILNDDLIDKVRQNHHHQPSSSSI